MPARWWPGWTARNQRKTCSSCGVAAVLDRGGAQAADDRPGPGQRKGRDAVEEGPGRRRVAAGGEGGGDAGEGAVVGEGAVDGAAVALHDPEGAAVVARGHEAPLPGVVGPDGDPAGVVQEGGGDHARGGGVLGCARAHEWRSRAASLQNVLLAVVS